MSPNAQIESAQAKLFKGTHPGASETHLLTDEFGREVHVTWRGGKLAGIKYVGGNNFIRADCLGPRARQRWASPPAQDRRAA